APTGVWTGLAWSPELGLFVAVDGTQGRGKVMTSPDGANWTIAAETSSHWYDVVWSAELGIFVAVGYSFTDQRKVMTSSDGVNWTLRDTPSNAFHFWFSVVWAADLGLFVALAQGGAPTQVMVSPDGVNWTLNQVAEAQWWDLNYSAQLHRFIGVNNGFNRQFVLVGDAAAPEQGPSDSVRAGFGADPTTGVLISEPVNTAT